MSKHKPLPPLERLQGLFEVETSGRLIYKERPHPCSRHKPGDEAGTLQSTGYRTVKIDKCMYYVHRVVWVLFYGQDPGDFLIDHINRDRSDNRPSNLRLCDHGQNNLNKSLASSGKSGIRGVCFLSQYKKKPWVAQYRCKYLGRFATKEEAIMAIADAVESRGDGAFYYAGN
jgi:hypothetical protein